MKLNIILFSIISVALIVSCNSNTKSNSETKEYTQRQLDSLIRIECNIILKELVESEKNKFIEIATIPNTFDESLIILDSMINDDMKEWIKCLPDTEFGTYVHHSLGRNLRNKWGLWGDTKFWNNLSQLEVFHPDDMSAIILDSYQRKLKGEDIKLEEQIKSYQDYWTRRDSIKKTRNDN